MNIVMGLNKTFEITPDMANSMMLLGLVSLIIILYAVRLAVRGKAQFSRTDREGGSALLGKGIMEMAYWSLQPFAKLMILMRVTPNMISWTSLVLGIFAGACLAFGHFGFGAVFATFSALCDALDGMIARETGVASDSGEVLDAAIDRYAEFIYLAGLVIYYREIPVMMILVLMALLGSYMVSYSTAKAEALKITPPRGNMRRSERATYLITGAALAPISIPWLETISVYPVPLGYPMVIALGIVAFLSNVSAAERFYFIATSVRERDEKREFQKLLEAAARTDEEVDALQKSLLE